MAHICGCGCGAETRGGQYLRGHDRRAHAAATRSERFWARVEKSDACWRWTGALDHEGYGRMNLDGRNHHAHRAAWILLHGEPADGLSVLHSCDNAACVRPDHLRLGTHAENMADKVARGRQARGSTHGSAKLNEIQAVEIVRRRKEGDSHNTLALAYGVSIYTIVSVLKGEHWSHVTGRGAA